MHEPKKPLNQPSANQTFENLNIEQQSYVKNTFCLYVERLWTLCLNGINAFKRINVEFSWQRNTLRN